MSKHSLLKVVVAAIVVLSNIVAIFTPTNKAIANGAPFWLTQLRPANDSWASSNTPTLCVRNNGDPENEQVYVRFKVYGGSETDKLSDWIHGGASGSEVCWTTPQLTPEKHSWSAGAKDSSGHEGGATGDWGINIPASPSQPKFTCSVTHTGTNPSPPTDIGSIVTLNGTATCNTGVNTIRFFLDGNFIGETSGGSGNIQWNTSGYSSGDHTVRVEAQAVGDSNWNGSGSQGFSLKAGNNNNNQQQNQQPQTQQSQQQQNTNPPISPSSCGAQSDNYTMDIWSNKTTINKGEETVLKWKAENVCSVYLSYNGKKDPYSGNYEISVNPKVTTTYTLEVLTRSNGVKTKQVTINVNGGDIVTKPPPPIIQDPGPTTYYQFGANPSSLIVGQCTTLLWSTNNVQSVHLHINSRRDGVGGNSSRSNVCPTTTTTYMLEVELRNGEVKYLYAPVQVMGITISSQPATTSGDLIRNPLNRFDLFDRSATTSGQLR